MAKTIPAADVSAAYAHATKLQEVGQLKQAHAIYLQIVRQFPKAAEAHWQIGRIARRIGDRRAAVESLARAHALKPREPAVLREFGAALSEAGDSKAAIPVLRNLLEIAPDDFRARSELAILLQHLGEFEEAEVELRRCLKLQPANGVIYRFIVSGRKIAADDPIIKEMEALKRRKDIEPRHRANLEFALAKALEDAGDYPRSWEYLRKGNRELANLVPYSAAARKAEVDALIASMEGVDFSRKIVEPDESFQPIIVTGIPRCGSTLAEQIIGAHSEVTPLGEATELGRAISEMTAHRARSSFASLADATPDELIAVRNRYKDLLQRRFSFGAKFTDKSMSYWHHIGFMHMAIPNAKIIVMQRDPRDNLISIFKNVFAEGTHTYSNRIQDMVDYLKSHRRVMDFWRQTIPDAFVEMQYEDLVTRPEEKARELVAAAGLAWEDGCLDYWKQKRDVKTLSVAQVRQPVYTSSRKAWQKWGKSIDPLIEALDREGLLPHDA